MNREPGRRHSGLYRRVEAGAAVKVLAAAAGLGVLVLGAAWYLAGSAPGEGDGDVMRLRWATSSVGSAGHRAKVSLMAVLNRELPGYRIDVVPTAGAVATSRGYAVGEFDGCYGADVAFRELAEDAGRFRGFGEHVRREPVQSFWAYTMEVGLAVRADEHAGYEGWGDLDGRPVFTGPAPWDVRAQLERALGCWASATDTASWMSG